MNKLQQLKKWVKTTDHPIARAIKQTHDVLHHFEIPQVNVLYKTIHIMHNLIALIATSVMRVLYWTPMFKTKLQSNCKRLYLYGGMPLVQGSLKITMGDNCRLSGQTTFSGRWSGSQTPELTIGNNVGIAWQTTIAVGTKVVIGDNVRIAGRGFLAGYPGHPIDPVARAKGLPDTDDQVGEIILERDVWLGSGVTVMKGVTIGEGTIVAAGSVVTQSLPPFVMAAGVPAKILRKLPQSVISSTAPLQSIKSKEDANSDKEYAA